MKKITQKTILNKDSAARLENNYVWIFNKGVVEIVRFEDDWVAGVFFKSIISQLHTLKEEEREKNDK